MDANGRRALGGLLIAASVGLAGCQEAGIGTSTARVGPPVRPVLIQKAAYVERQRERGFVGTVRPRVESDLGFRISGKVARRLVSVGDVVRAGQPLAELDEIDPILQAEQAEAELSSAQASLRQAQADYTRTETLTEKGFAAGASLDRQRAAAAEARGRVLKAERALSLARNARSYAVLTADADGVVTATSVEPGSVVSAGQSALRIAQTGEKEAVVAIPETLVALAGGGRAVVTLWSNPGKRYAAKLRELSPAADPATRTYLARFSVPDADDAVQLGMTATVTLADDSPARIVRLPLSALFNQGEGPAVWTVGADGRPVLKPVQVAAYEAKDVLIRSGIEEGESVVTLGVSKLDSGQSVKIVEALQF